MPEQIERSKRRNKPVKNLYVIRLDAAVLQRRKFVEANPAYRAGKPCSYVGVTSLDPEDRFKQHRDGHKASPIARKYGKYLQNKQFEHLNPVPAAEAENRERALAIELRSKGWGVWQH